MRTNRAGDLPVAATFGVAVAFVAAVGLSSLAIGHWGGNLTMPVLAIGLVSLQLATFRIGRPARAPRLARIARSSPDLGARP